MTDPRMKSSITGTSGRNTSPQSIPMCPPPGSVTIPAGFVPEQLLISPGGGMGAGPSGVNDLCANEGERRYTCCGARDMVGVAQLVEHRVVVPGVGGSSPLT